MTRPTKERLEEIRARLSAFKFYAEKKCTVPAWDESHGPDMEALLAEIDALRAERDKYKQDMNLAVSSAGKDLIAECDRLRAQLACAKEGLEKIQKADPLRTPRLVYSTTARDTLAKIEAMEKHER